MGYAKKELFSVPYLTEGEKIDLGSEFPPNKINYCSEGRETMLSYLGESNYNDLIKFAERNKNSDCEVDNAERIKQFIFTDRTGELFEVCIILCSNGIAKMSGIRTRRKS